MKLLASIFEAKAKPKTSQSQSQSLSLSQAKAKPLFFKDAPVLMGFRRNTAASQEMNCQLHNHSQIRVLAKDAGVPVIRFPALHDGVSHEAGSKMDEMKFQGLPGSWVGAAGPKPIGTYSSRWTASENVSATLLVPYIPNLLSATKLLNMNCVRNCPPGLPAYYRHAALVADLKAYLV